IPFFYPFLNFFFNLLISRFLKIKVFSSPHLDSKERMTLSTNFRGSAALTSVKLPFLFIKSLKIHALLHSAIHFAYSR
ncbi:hypothetical protein, partial [Flavobacterium sp. LS1R10]|uniref:hypothetical protein n=1 Tax=Flavobacterium sp. LS1R10 TaxID=2497482 RepID=UPI001F318BA7